MARVDQTAGEGAYYNDDLRAIQAGAVRDGLLYAGEPQTPGFRAVRQTAGAILLRLVDRDGVEGWGDAIAVQYAGVGGRDGPVDPVALAGQVERGAAALRAAGAVTFAEGCAIVEAERVDGRPLHAAVRHGLGHALLALVAARARRPMLDVLLPLTGVAEPRMAPLYAQCGEERRANVDRMLLRRVDVIPHGLINAPSVFGPDGDGVVEYAAWVRERVLRHGPEGYEPILHLDVYGLGGRELGLELGPLVRFCRRVAEAAAPFRLQLESVLYGASTGETIERLAGLRSALREEGVALALVADEYCNTLDDVRAFAAAGACDLIQLKTPDMGAPTVVVEAALACRAAGLGVFVGGSCTETDGSARVAAHLGLALAADQVLARPGMGVDEGVAIVRNEMARALLAHRPGV